MCLRCDPFFFAEWPLPIHAGSNLGNFGGGLGLIYEMPPI